MATDLVTVTINGRPVRAPKGTLLVDAAAGAGIEIPVFCYHPKLKPVGACRMCLVSIEKMPRLQTACTTPITDGMIVHTNTPEVTSAQNGVIEFLLANHPLDCPICDKGGECPLQDNSFAFGIGVSRFTEGKLHKDKAFPLSERIVLDRERCILCYRCTRFQAEIPGDEALVAMERGGISEIGTLEGETFDSIFSGNTIELCPVGALTSRQYRFRARPWDLRRTPSTCAGCAVGCNISIHSRNARVLRLVSREHPAVDDGWLCDYGRFDTMPPAREHRVLTPRVRRGSTLEETTLHEALERAVALLRAPGAGALLSPSLSNEALWVFAQVLRPRLPLEAEAACWPRADALWPLRGEIASVASSKTILLIGLDAWHELPVLALWIRRAVVRNGAKLVVIGAANGLYRDTAAWLHMERGAEAQALDGLLEALGHGVSAEASARGAPPRVDLAQLSEDERRAHLDAVAGLLAGRPTTLLVGPHVARDGRARALLERLAAALQAGEDGGMVGSPALAANGRGAMELAPELAQRDPADVVGRARSLLLVGQETWPTVPAARLVVASTVVPATLDQVDVLLPLAHPYEQSGSLTNLEGRVQQLEPGGAAPPQALMDWHLLTELAGLLGASLVPELAKVRAALALAHPAYATALAGGLPQRGWVLSGVGSGRD